MKTHQSAVVLIPPEGLWREIQGIRAHHDRGYRRWMPHITLLYPFLPLSELSSVADRFRTALADFAPFEVTLTGLSSFSQRRGRVYWLKPEPLETLRALQSRLWSCVPDCDDTQRHGNGFTPHLTVAQGQDLDLVAPPPLTFTVSDVSLIYRNDAPDDVFRVAERVKLGA